MPRAICHSVGDPDFATQYLTLVKDILEEQKTNRENSKKLVELMYFLYPEFDEIPNLNQLPELVSFSGSLAREYTHSFHLLYELWLTILEITPWSDLAEVDKKREELLSEIATMGFRR